MSITDKRDVETKASGASASRVYTKFRHGAGHDETPDSFVCKFPLKTRLKKRIRLSLPHHGLSTSGLYRFVNLPSCSASLEGMAFASVVLNVNHWNA
jgi:hypothetical protein